MQQYHSLLRHMLDEGVRKGDRTEIGTLSVFGPLNGGANVTFLRESC